MSSEGSLHAGIMSAMPVWEKFANIKQELPAKLRLPEIDGSKFWVEGPVDRRAADCL
jgi:hypothetical protein